MKPKAVVLLSGGLDSATTLALAKSGGFDLYALSFSYGQRHTAELAAAACIADQIGVVRHVIAPIDLRAFGDSALLSTEVEVPKDRTAQDIETGIPITYVPARNTIFLAFALSWAEVIGADSIFLGVNAVDYSGYPDCRLEYIEAFERLANLATKRGVEGQHVQIKTPLIRLSKAEIIRTGTRLGVDYSSTVTCYDANTEGRACGRCDACQLRRQGFASADITDPTRYCA